MIFLVAITYSSGEELLSNDFYDFEHRAAKAAVERLVVVRNIVNEQVFFEV